MALDAQVLRAAMRQWATGVTVVTSALGDQRSGMTVSSFTSVSLEPPTVLVCLNQSTLTHKVVAESGVYAISMLANDQEALSNRFAGYDPTIVDRFEGLEIQTAETGSPLLGGAIVWLDCQVKSTLHTGTHSIFVAEVVFAQVSSEAEPLIYHNRAYKVLVDRVKTETT